MSLAGVFEAELSIPWDSLPRYCFMGPPEGEASGHACLTKVVAISRKRGSLRHLVQVDGKYSRGTAKVLVAHEKGARIHPVSRTSYLSVVETPVCPMYEALSSTSCFLIGETAKSGYLSWDVIAESRGAIKALVGNFAEAGVSAEVLRAEKINGGRRLTERQEQILKQAYECGFFKSPKHTSVRELAAALGCSPSTFARLLKKAERKVLAERFGPGTFGDR
jgi:predicted DNA binding protein